MLKLCLGNTAFVDFGSKFSGRLGLGVPSPALDLGIGLAGTAHLGFRGIAGGIFGMLIDPIDIFLELGGCFDFLPNSKFPIGPVINSGINYWIGSGLAFGIKYTHWNSFDGVTISAQLKFTYRPAPEPVDDQMIGI